jgi:peptidyl-prolyl cis-trans isomerase SurA
MSRALLGLALIALVTGCASSDPGAARPGPGAEGRPEPAPRPTPADDLVDRVVAVVNNDAITLGELQETIAAVRRESRGRVAESDEELGRQFLTRLIETRLQLQEAEREKVVVEASEVEEELAERMKRFGAYNKAEIEALVTGQGLSLDAVKRRVRDAIRVGKVIRRKVTLRVSVTEGEIDQYLTQNRDKLETGLTYHARHILVPPADDSDAAWEAARMRAELLRARLVDGGDFTELARQQSRDASAKDGGDLGTLKRGELAPEIEAQILRLQPGEISPPYRSSLGYHLFRLETKEVLEGGALQRARQQVRDILFRQKYEARLEAWLKEIRQRAIIEVRL